MAALLVLAQHRPHPTIVHSPSRLVDLTDRATIAGDDTGLAAAIAPMQPLAAPDAGEATAQARPALPGPAILRQPRIELGHDPATGSYHLSITPQLPRW